MRRSLLLLFTVFGALLGMLLGSVPAAADGCDGDFAARLSCWANRAGSGPMLVTLDDQLPLDGSKAYREQIEQDIRTHRDKLVVEVPAGKRTGEGGTALLLLAGGRIVARDALIDRLPEGAVGELQAAGVCEPSTPKDPCEVVARTGKANGLLHGSDLIKAGVAADRSKNRDSIAARAHTPSHDLTFWIVLSMSILLGLLLIALLAMIRRSRAPAAPRRALAASGVGALSSGSGPGARTRAEPGVRQRSDESTTRLRTTPPARRHGRDVGARSGSARTAVVRTELHPQGYVEVDRVLYRAVWAEPGRPPPAPGGPVDVTDARERNSDVLYAFPTTAGRHAKGQQR